MATGEALLEGAGAGGGLGLTAPERASGLKEGPGAVATVAPLREEAAAGRGLAVAGGLAGPEPARRLGGEETTQARAPPSSTNSSRVNSAVIRRGGLEGPGVSGGRLPFVGWPLKADSPAGRAIREGEPVRQASRAWRISPMA